MSTNLNQPSLMPNRRISEEEFDAIQAAHRGDVSDMLRRVAYVAREHRQAACTGNACRSGREPCPTPEACQLPARDENDDSQFGALEGMVRGLPYLAAAWAVVAVLAFLAWLKWWPL